jgi:hypothetical protein
METRHANMDSCYMIQHYKFYPIVSPSSDGLCNPLVGNFYNMKGKKKKKTNMCLGGTLLQKDRKYVSKQI